MTLRSADPREPPHVNFRYFEEGSDPAGEDLDSVVAGIKLVRAHHRADSGGTGSSPRRSCRASTCGPTTSFATSCATTPGATTRPAPARSGRGSSGGVLTADFRVHGTRGLRVVDASVFPRIPGFFIVSAVYMVAEKAAEVMLDDAALGAQ